MTSIRYVPQDENVSDIDLRVIVNGDVSQRLQYRVRRWISKESVHTDDIWHECEWSEWQDVPHILREDAQEDQYSVDD